MDSLIGKVAGLLRQKFPGSEVALDADTPDARIGGLLVWDGFVGQDRLDRQHSVRQLIRENFPDEQRLRATFIVTLIPEENEIMQSN